MSRELAAVGGLRPEPGAGCPTPTPEACTRRTRGWPCATPATSTPGARRASRSGWCLPSAITACSPDEKDAFFDPAADKIYRHPTFYDIPERGAAPVTMRPADARELRAAAGRRRADPGPAARRVGLVARRNSRRTSRWPTSPSTCSARPARCSAYAGEVEGTGRTEDDLAYLPRRARVQQLRSWSSCPTATSPSHDGAPAAVLELPVELYQTRCSDSRRRDARRRRGQGGQGGRLPPRPCRRSGRCGSATAPRSPTGGCKPGCERVWPYRRRDVPRARPLEPDRSRPVSRWTRRPASGLERVRRRVLRRRRWSTRGRRRWSARRTAGPAHRGHAGTCWRRCSTWHRAHPGATW